MTLNDLKTQVKSYLIASIESGNFMLNDEFLPELRQKAHQLGLSDADLQRLINIVSKELNPDEILEQARQRKLSEQVEPPPTDETTSASVIAPQPPTDDDEAANRRYEEALKVLAAMEQKEEAPQPELPQEEDIFQMDWQTAQPSPQEDEAALEEAKKRAEAEAAEEEQRRLAELRAREEALARKKAEEEAVERHNRLIREKQQAENHEAPPQPSSGDKPIIGAKKPTFEGKKKATATEAAGGSLMKKALPFIIAFVALGGGGVATFFWYKNNLSSNTASSKRPMPTLSLTRSNLAETDLVGIYEGSVTNRNETEPIQIEIYDVKIAVNQRFRFQFRGMLQQRKQNMQGFGETEPSKGTIYMGHRLMGDASISKADDGTVTIQGANFQLTKKP